MDPPSDPLTFLTSTSLLEGLRDREDAGHWERFVGRYRPLVVGTARRAGLSDSDAEDLAQAVMLSFCESYLAGRYERERGRLRSWLYGILRNKLLQHRAAPAAQRECAAPLEHLEAPDELEAIWEDEWQQALVSKCLEQVRQEVNAETYAAFHAFAVEGEPAREVAERHGLSENAVFLAKRRILRRVRELLPLIEETW